MSPEPTSARTGTWHVIVPVKSRFRAKARLLPPPEIDKPQLALALALDTLDAVLEVVPPERLIVVSEDDEVDRAMANRDVQTVADPARGLNPAVQAGLAEAVRRGPHRPAAVLLGDLPALRPADLSAGLRACAATESALIPDHDGSGTVLLTHHDPAALAPRFGRGSAARHARQSTVLSLDLPSLRHDVDDLDSLALAVDLGVGPHTARVLQHDQPRSA